MHAPPGPETVIDGTRYLYFGGTGYLGLANHPDVIAAGCQALQTYGVHSATTRARFGTTQPLLDVETNAAHFFATADAFYFTSGYIANHILVAALAGSVDAVLVDQTAHYCLGEAAPLAGKPVHHFNHHDPNHLAELAAVHPRVLVMADAVAPSTGHTPPVHDYLAALQNNTSATLLLDDAHGFGVLGDHGRGLLDQLGLWHHANGGPPLGNTSLAVGGTTAKALGGFGGIIPGTGDFIAHTRTASHVFDGASAPPSAVCGSTAKALEILTAHPEIRHRHRANIRHLRQNLRDIGLDISTEDTANFAVATGDATQLQNAHQALKSEHIWLPYISEYSGIPPGGILRFAVFADHTTDQLDQVTDALKRYL